MVKDGYWFLKRMVIFNILFILMCNWVKRAEIVKDCSKDYSKFRFSANLHDTQTQVRLFASFQNSVKKTMIFQPTNQLNLKEKKGCCALNMQIL